MNTDAYHRILAGEALTFVLSPRALWRLNGPDAARYLNGQVTNDVLRLAEGTGCYAAVCTAKGRMEGDVSIGLLKGEFYLDADVVLRESLGARLEKYLIADDAVLEDISDLWTLSHVFGAAMPELPESAFAIRYARFGLPGHDIWMAGSGAAIIGESVPADVIEAVRLKLAVPRWGAELTTNTLPPEAGPHMLEAISYTKGCYVGQETIARLKSVGHVNRTLVLLQSDSEEFPPVGAPIIYADRAAGAVTSSGVSPKTQKGLALAYVPRLAAEVGTKVIAGGLSMTVVST
jgi:folate-binding protein YgfZ